MSPVVDETAGDLPVRDVGLIKRGLMPAVHDNQHELKQHKKHIFSKKKDPQRLFRFPREPPEDLCHRLQEENNVLRQHIFTQEQRLRKMSTRLMRLRQARPGSSSVKERDMEDTIQELEAHVAMLESQKGVLQNKLSMAKQHIIDLGGRTPYKFSKGKTGDMNGEVRKAPQTAPPRYGPMLEDTRMEIERFRSSVAEQVRVAELELTAQALRETLREKEKEIEETVKEMRKQQTDRHRITIREDVDLIRLQKQLSDKSTALRLSQERFSTMQEAYETQLEESQRSLRESQRTLLEKVEEQTEQLKQERQRASFLEKELTSSSLSLQTLDKLQERISDLEEERDLLKENYNTLLERTLAAQKNPVFLTEKWRENDQKRDTEGEKVREINIEILEEMLQAEREERGKLMLEKENLRQEKEILQEQREQERESSVIMRNEQQHLEQKLLHYEEQVSSLQNTLDSVTKEFDMSVEELSEILLQIKAFRLQQESRTSLCFLSTEEKVDDSLQEVTNMRASYAETFLELQKTRNLLLLEHHISKDMQVELNTIKQKMEKEREESKRTVAEKDKLLSKQMHQINSLQTQTREFAYSLKRTIPVQYTWPAGHSGAEQPVEDFAFLQLRADESLLEIHLKAATFTPSGLSAMGRIKPGAEDIVTFCTYSLLDFEMHSTPLVLGNQPSYNFKSHYALTAQDLSRLEGQGSRVRVELHQSLGGVTFLTHGSGQMSLDDIMEGRGGQISRCVNITSSAGEVVGVLDFVVCLFSAEKPTNTVRERRAGRTTATTTPLQISLGWQNGAGEELYDYGCGIPNELEIMLEGCVGLSARWPGLFPDAYLAYRLYDLPPHISQIIKGTPDPVFNDITSYPLAVTTDVLHYLRSSSLWVYLFDDTNDQVPPVYLAKTPIPLRALASGHDIRGDYVLRDPAGGPRGVVKVVMKWKYPVKPSLDTVFGAQERRNSAITQRTDREEGKGEEAETSQRPVAKPRVKPQFLGHIQTKAVHKDTKARPLKAQQNGSERKRPHQPLLSHVADRTRSTESSPTQGASSLRVEPGRSRVETRKSSEGSSSTLSRRGSSSDARTQGHDTMYEEDKEEEQTDRGGTDTPESSEASSSQSDIIIIPPQRRMRKGDNLRIEILSLMFEPSSYVALDDTVQRVYVEYRLLGIPTETTETPMSLRKPTEGKEIHYNFTRVIYVNGLQSAPLRQYLYTMLEGTDPNQGRLKFTVVSEPMEDDQECVDVGHAFLDLQELLLTGNDVISQQLDIVSADEKREVIGNLRVSLEAAKTLNGIYQEFSEKGKVKVKDKTDKGTEEDQRREDREETNKNQMQVVDFDYDSDFY